MLVGIHGALKYLRTVFKRAMLGYSLVQKVETLGQWNLLKI